MNPSCSCHCTCLRDYYSLAIKRATVSFLLHFGTTLTKKVPKLQNWESEGIILYA